MEILQQTNFIRLLTSPSFWTNVLLVVVITAVTYWVANKILAVLHKRIANWTKDHESAALYHVFLDVISKTRKALILVAAFLFSLQFVTLSDRLHSLISHAWFLVLALQIAMWLDQAVQSWMRHSLLRPGLHRNPVTLIILGLMIRALIWSIMLLSILANAGVDITALVASLGVGGIAIALAVQTVLSDVFASLSIGFDKPFEIGDFIVFNDVSGTIEHIGLKTTRIRSLSGEQIVCANAILLQQTIHNYKRMQTRRIVFTFGIAYSTPPEKIRKIGPMVKRVIESIKETRFDRAHFSVFDQDRLTFEVVHILNTADYNQYMDIQQEINIRIMEELDQMDVKLAIPSRIIIPQDQPEDEPQERERLRA